MNENPFDSQSRTKKQFNLRTSVKNPFDGKMQSKSGSGVIILGAFIIIIVLVIAGSGMVADRYHKYQIEKTFEEIAGGTYDGDYSEFEYLLE